MTSIQSRATFDPEESKLIPWLRSRNKNIVTSQDNEMIDRIQKQLDKMKLESA